MFGLSSEFPLNYSAAGEKKITRFRGYLKGKIWLCYNSYRDAQKRSGPDFPNVNYGVKFLKFDSDLVRELRYL